MSESQISTSSVPSIELPIAAVCRWRTPGGTPKVDRGSRRSSRGTQCRCEPQPRRSRALAGRKRRGDPREERLVQLQRIDAGYVAVDTLVGVEDGDEADSARVAVVSPSTASVADWICEALAGGAGGVAPPLGSPPEGGRWMAGMTAAATTSARRCTASTPACLDDPFSRLAALVWYGIGGDGDAA